MRFTTRPPHHTLCQCCRPKVSSTSQNKSNARPTQITKFKRLIYLYKIATAGFRRESYCIQSQMLIVSLNCAVARSLVKQTATAPFTSVRPPVCVSFVPYQYICASSNVSKRFGSSPQTANRVNFVFVPIVFVNVYSTLVSAFGFLYRSR